MNLDPAADRALYRQLADLLREQIERGELPAGADLPSARTLAQTHGVGLDTVRDTLSQLRAEGLITTVRGVGSRVREPVRERVVDVAEGAFVRARMPTPGERREMGVGDGVPVLVVSAGDGDQVHPADRTALRLSPSV